MATRKIEPGEIIAIDRPQIRYLDPEFMKVLLNYYAPKLVKKNVILLRSMNWIFIDEYISTESLLALLGCNKTQSLSL